VFLFFSLEGMLSDFLNFSAFDAGRANADATAGAVDESADFFQIDVPAPLGDIVRVADPVAELRPPSTHITRFRHKTKSSLYD
jgi:hypothetical protein